ncbi:ThiF family adenylyltransferase [Aeromicrobium sp. Leaf350]|uniref:ThiF family adenylyltransferase n=1 Tax=Aeromicrobium sp. Leaf350 TaxID=2876565 RepID=UPI001E526E6B|nr:ThiF family adenylyltransferase [Aeromicrobium sp. Leaf350]
MRIVFYQGWPLRYAHVIVDGLRADHAADGTICLWAEDDPAQVAGRDIGQLWRRLDEWAAAARQGFRTEDRALDAYVLFDNRSAWRSELPFNDLVEQGTNGFKTPLVASKQGRTLLISPKNDASSEEGETLQGAFYLRNNIGPVPRHFDDIARALTKKQSADLAQGLANRAAVGAAEVSGGYDFIVLGWPRHDKEHDAVAVLIAGAGDELQAEAMAASANDVTARRRRSGPDSDLLAGKTVLIAGAGSVGGHVAVALASSGVRNLRIHDDDDLTSANLVRHVAPTYAVGYRKVVGVSVAAEDHAPWVTVTSGDNLPGGATSLMTALEGVDLVIDCTGIFHVTATLAEVCRRTDRPLIVGALFHQGALARVQRQGKGDTLIAARPANPAYLKLPPEDLTEPSGFLELGCTAPVNNAPPTSVLAAAADIAHAAVDYMTGRRERSDERIIVLRAMTAPFHRPGTLDSPGTNGGDAI